jgi:hypothetical protein
MQADDRILVGVIKAKRDLKILHAQHWYRIPQGNAPKGIDADYLAFFLSGKVPDGQPGIYYYAERRGMELAKRKDLLPGKKPHPRDDNLYHKIQLGEIQTKSPPVVNHPQPHKFAFIYTTGDRFLQARHIRDLYSDADYFVDRVFTVLKDKGYKPRRTWEKPAKTAANVTELEYPTYAQIRMVAEGGEIVASTSHEDQQSSTGDGEFLYLPPSQSRQAIRESAAAIIAAVERLGGPGMLDIPIELY